MILSSYSYFTYFFLFCYFIFSFLECMRGPGPLKVHDGYRSARSNSMRTVIEVMYQRPLSLSLVFSFFSPCFCVVVIPRRGRLSFSMCRSMVASSAPVGRKQMIRNKFPMCFFFFWLCSPFFSLQQNKMRRRRSNASFQ